MHIVAPAFKFSLACKPEGREIAIRAKKTLGQLHKSWVHGANHRDSSVHLHSAPMPNFLRSYFLAQKFGLGHKTAYEIDPRTGLFKN